MSLSSTLLVCPPPFSPMRKLILTPFPKQMLECKVKDSALFYSICNDETSWRSQILTSFGWLLQILMFSLVKIQIFSFGSAALTPCLMTNFKIKSHVFYWCISLEYFAFLMCVQSSIISMSRNIYTI